MQSARHGLIVDVGMHTGQDTEFYLRKGFRVVAIEANPDLVESVSARLDAFVQSGQLEVIPMAVSDQRGEAEFFVSSQDSGWSSLDPEMATHGIPHALGKRVKVMCAPLEEVLRDVPPAHYMKIDIEGSDLLCIRALPALQSLPRYVSFEADLTEGGKGTFEALDLLAGMGYRRFKLINQATHHLTSAPSPALEGDYVRVSFDKHSSGLFGEETPGPWLDRADVEDRCRDLVRTQSARIGYTKTGRVAGIPVARFHKPLAALYNAKVVTRLRAEYARRRGRELGGWFDIHAAL
jgi:FkbM family methyltransferase